MTNSEARKRHATPPAPDALDAIRARLEAATEGPWEVGHEWVYFGGAYESPSDALRGIAHNTTPADAEFIAHARTDIPLLLAELDEARADFLIWVEEARVLHAEVRDANARATAAESARDAAEGAIERVRELHDKTHWCFDVNEQDCLWEAGTDWWPCPTLEALAPVTTDETEGGGQ